MKLSKPITLNKSRRIDVFYRFKVSQVMFKVMNKSIDRDIIYSILTLITLLFVYPYMCARTRAHESSIFFSGNKVRIGTFRYAAVKKILTLSLTSLPLNSISYLKTPLTYGGI